MAASKNHHWWPKGVSTFWQDDNGCTTWLSPNGNLRTVPPKHLGVIGHGHSIKLSRIAGKSTVWDQNFEDEFQRADDNFPSIIEWLDGQLDRRLIAAGLRERFVAQDVSEQKLSQLVERIVSLAVRSPMTREAAVSLAELYRGKLPERERNGLIGLNLRDLHRSAMRSIGTRGKVGVIYSPDREFIFGDGFYHNIKPPMGPGHFGAQILAPLTPRISVLFARPTQYDTEPRLATLVATAEEADGMNRTIQIYAKEMVFYRNEQPTIFPEFSQAEHLEYQGPNHPVNQLVHALPGVARRNTALDFLLQAGRHHTP